MVTSPEAIARNTPLAAPHNSAKRSERLFFTGISVALLITVFVGFAPTYYLRQSFASAELTPSLYVHGFAFTTWMILLVVQTSLIAANKVAVHRRVGVAGAVLGVLMMFLGGYVAITRARAGLMLSPPGIPLSVFITIPLGTLVVFPVLFGAALWFRRRTDIHKRLVLIATLELVTAAVARWPGMAPLGLIGFFGVTDLFLVALAVYDWRTRGRLHPATIWGGLFLIAWQPLRLAIGFTPAWQSFVGWLVS